MVIVADSLFGTVFFEKASQDDIGLFAAIKEQLSEKMPPVDWEGPRRGEVNGMQTIADTFSSQEISGSLSTFATPHGVLIVFCNYPPGDLHGVHLANDLLSSVQLLE